MKVKIDTNGMLTIIAKNDLEGYALERWSRDNVNKNTPNLTVTWSPGNYKKNKL